MFLAAAIGITFFVYAWIRYKNNIGTRGRYEPLEKYQLDDLKSNHVRKKEISEEYFVRPDIGRLPFMEKPDGSLARLQETVRSRASSKMIRLPKQMDNIEVKMTFGTANLEVVTQCEENYYRFIMALVSWGEQLYKEGYVKEAEEALLESVALGSDMSRSYTLLIDLYEGRGDAEKLGELREIVENSEALKANSGLKIRLLDRLGGSA